MKFIYTLFALFTILVFTGCNDKPEQENTPPVKEHTTVAQSSYTIEDISSGEKFVLKRENGGFVVEGHEDKVIMFDMYATYCPPCRKEAPHLTDLQVKYLDKLLIIALNTFEDVSDTYIDDKFRYSYGAFYFISNSKHNNIIIDTILKDIKYEPSMQIPFKVILKDTKYQKLTDIYGNNPNNNFYLGAISSSVIEKDLKKIFEQPQN
ncbi:MAG: thioredoxin domain-containing protein [Sulfurimonas sp.]|uniref:TlpA family protein disulfide reductase n=1 Tax=Sulfurimonas sp. TaxID=2022749 RepID=UPI00262477FB|nr:thioredoxin domain-containing protein [Sulfurimonas sp.]MCW8894876.1 thioredoxin domain-containing protein [Sulfurimonas sp.]MCW8953714.1 thioredoxin domain-containing protein [Sulfurimonas sp.]MCW9067738.1 thioredoxin domain-containing protein [Sulfurimonas sp.]